MQQERSVVVIGVKVVIGYWIGKRRRRKLKRCRKRKKIGCRQERDEHRQQNKKKKRRTQQCKNEEGYRKGAPKNGTGRERYREGRRIEGRWWDKRMKEPVESGERTEDERTAGRNNNKRSKKEEQKEQKTALAF